MFHINLYFGTLQVLAIFLGGATVVVALLARSWPWLLQGRRLRVAAVGLLLVEVVVLAGWAATTRFDSDEIEHLHVSWLVSQGLIPFNNFWQNHSPMVYFMAAPVVDLFRSSAVVFFSRAVAGVLFLIFTAATGWLCWRAFRDRVSAALASILLLAFGVRLEAAWFRPDCFTNLLIVLALGLAAVPAPTPALAFLSGVFLAFGLSLTPKAFLLVLAFPLAVLLAAPAPQKAKLLLFHLLGGLAGVAPFLALLWNFGMLQGFVHWALLHHAVHFRLTNSFPAVLGALAGVSAYRACAGARSVPHCLLAGALILQTFGALLTPYVPVDMVPWIALAAVLAAPLIVAWFRGPEGTGGTAVPPRSWLAATALVLILSNAYVPAFVFSARLGNAALDAARFDWMLKMAGNEPVLLITPVHDVYSRDATRLYLLWQYSHYLPDPAIQADLANVAADVERLRPRLILARPRLLTDYIADPNARPEIFQRLASMGVISQVDLANLRHFLNEQYEEREVYGERFYVRVR